MPGKRFLTDSNRIRTSETVLAPAAALFTHLLDLNDKSVKSVAEDCRGVGPGLRTIDPRRVQEFASGI